MAQPTPYTRQFDFSDFQTVNPARPLPGSELDAELDRVKLTSDQTLANLAKIQRDDGRLNNQSVTPESLSAATLALIAQGEYNPRGFWAAATAYAVGDLVEFNAATFLALVAHTSDTQFTTDQTAGRWLLIANGAISGQDAALDLFEGTGSQTVFTVSFNYNGDEAATVFVGGVAQIPGQDFTIAGNTLTFVSAPPAPVVPGRKNVMVRGTGVEAQLAADAATASANNAANSATAASNSATAASGSASAALASQNAASASQSAAATSATNAATSASNAATSATNASNSAVAALASQNAAANSASAASTSATSAATSATTATNQATTATNQATAASNSASAAATSATNASNSASNASGSATVATQQATIATNAANAAGGSESNAAASASQAATSASNASASASSASSSASSANTSAVNAAASATSAGNSATAAGNSAGAASTSATNAAASESSVAANAGIATTKAAEAAASATAASTSATSASTSATSASGSATAAANSAALANAVSLANEPVRHSVRPSLLLDFANTKALDPRITFARASTARFYDGKTVAKAEENLLLRSQEFDDAAWSKVRSSITANTIVAPDGTITADKLVETTETGVHSVESGSVFVGLNKDVVGSFFAKAGERDNLAVNLSNITLSGNVWDFDLTAGTASFRQVGNGWANVGANILSVGNGWYRIDVYGTLTSTANSAGLVIRLNNGTTDSYAGDGTSGLFIWGAQLEQRSAVTAYTPTTTQPITNYVPVLLSAANNVARFDHNPVTGESLGLLIEEQRTNLFLRSEEFDDAYWIKVNTTVSSNVIVAPDGTLSADKLVNDPATSGYFGRASTIPLGVPVTVSVFAKQGEHKGAEIRFLTSTGSVAASFNLETGQVNSFSAASDASASGANITPVGNGWYRISVTGQLNSGATSQIRVFARNADGTTAAGNGFNGAYFWGTQVEQGAFPTSYIPTEASQVTRSADAASMTGANFSSWYRADEGTLFASANQSDIPTGAGFSYVTLRFNNDNAIGIGSTNANNIVRYNGVNELAFNLQPPTNALSKIALAYKVNDGAASLNGETPLTDSSFNLPLPNTLLIGQNRVTGMTAKLYVQKIAFYPKRLADAELQGLTQI
jgi:hypothetical protein